MGVDRLRVRAVIHEWSSVAIVACLLLAATGGWLTYTATATTPVTTEQRVVSSWETEGSFDHAATVTAPNPVFDVGTTLRDRGVYFTPVTPVLDGAFVFEYAASDGGSVTANSTLALRVRRVVEEDEGQTVLWSERRVLTRTTNRSVGPTEAIRVPFSVNVSAFRERTQRAENAFDDPPGHTDVTVVATVDLTGEVNGQRRERAERYALGITPERTVYRVSPNGSTATYETSRTVTIERPREGTMSLAGPGAILFSIVGLAALGWSRHSGLTELSERERERLAYRDDREDFDEWIVTMRPPEAVFDRPRVEADSLGDLVDFAIDTNNSVVEHPERGMYCVLHGDHLYVYRPPE